MKKRILALMLVVATVAPSLAIFASAVPYSPSANAWKDFGQEHNYIYEVTKGNAVPKIDGLVTEKDGYGDPIASYGFRYVTTAEKYRDDLDKGEYKLKDNGDYYVYPTADTPDGIWDSIASLENDNPFGYINTYYVQASSYTSSSLYFYNIENDTWTRAYKVTKENFGEYYAKNSSGNYILQAVQRLDGGEPVDWKTNYMNYYTKVSSAYKPVELTADGEVPAFKAKTYYYGEKILCEKLYTRQSAGANNSVARLAWLKRDRVPVPEEVNLYARYDDQYLYYALEVYEPEHKNIYYNNYNYWGTTMSNSVYVFGYNYDYASYYRKQLGDDTKPTSNISASSIRTYVNAATAVTSSAPILAKFGNPDATYNQVQVSGVDYNITHTPAPVKETAKPNEGESNLGDGTTDFDSGLDMGLDGGLDMGLDGGLDMGLDGGLDAGLDGGMTDDDPITSNGIKQSLRSGTYGTTVYEFRLPWVVINGKYSPDTHSTAVPEVFTAYQTVQLDNNIGRDTHTLALSLPRYVYNFSDSYGISEFMFRYPDRTGLTEGDAYGTYNFYWRTISGTTIWDVEPYTTDYYTVADRKKPTPSHVLPVFFTAGQEPREGYVEPEYAGASIRVDNAEQQKIRIKISVPKTEKEIAQVGAIVAPTEVVRDIQLKLGISSVAYYAYENPILYGLVDGEWVNLTTNVEKFFDIADTATPNDSDSFISYEEFGGKTSGVYTVHTLPVADLETPYDSTEDADVYTVVYGGANGEGIYNDFDDFNTFYTIRPYIKYKDGTVTYGEQEYKSIYYIACQLIQPMLVDYNTTVVGTTSQAKMYNMDMMPLTTYKDSNENVITDREGNPIYMPAEVSVSTTYSPYTGAAEYSIYLDGRREQVFKWYAVRTVGRRNNNTPIRVDDYETFDPNTKLLVKQYMDMYENIWDVILAAESNRYIKQK